MNRLINLMDTFEAFLIMAAIAAATLSLIIVGWIMKKKSLHNTDANGASKNVKDIVFWGNGDTFKLISKASSKLEGWMKSTKAMQAGESVVVQVTTQQQNIDGTYSIAEALTTVTNAVIVEHFTDGIVTSRTIEKRN